MANKWQWLAGKWWQEDASTVFSCHYFPASKDYCLIERMNGYDLGNPTGYLAASPP